MDEQLEVLSIIRKELDEVDSNIQTLINKRAQLALEIGRIKKANSETAYYRPEREAQILRTIAQRNDGPLSEQVVTHIFRTLMTACLALQKKIKVAFLGPTGTFTQAAALKHFGFEVDTVSCQSIDKVFREVDSGMADYGVVPIENSSNGVVDMTLDALMNSPQQICGEIILPIHHHLLRSKSASKILKRIYSHEQSLAQCKRWLDSHANDIEKIAVSSNGVAAEKAKTDLESAAIAGDLASETYELEKIVTHIEDHPQNQTRFLIIGKQKTAPSGIDKTTLLITTPHTPGALIKLIQPFADVGINITWIESRPYQHKIWSYLFFLDVEGHQQDESLQKALQILAKQPIMLNILGSYPKALL